MEGKSHVDISKIRVIPKNHYFEYRDVVCEDFPINKHSDDGALFNKEVENGVYDDVTIATDEAARIKYRKL